MNNIGIHCFVSGKVQGVWFRANTQKQARKLGLTGWVRNTDDGRVELMAFGPEDQVETFESWLHHGPPRAHVDHLSVDKVTWKSFPKFTVK